MSSMRNALQRRNHKERAQPAQREKWGILEKHKDYSLRAKDYNEKKKRLKILREKAAERNPDEFSYGMLSSKTDRYGRLIQDRGNPTLSQDAVKLLKTQDVGYVRTIVQQTRRSRKKMEEQYLLNNENLVPLAHGEGMSSGQHVIFAMSREEQQVLDLQEKHQKGPSPATDPIHHSFTAHDAQLEPQSSNNAHKSNHQTPHARSEELTTFQQKKAALKLRKRQKETQLLKVKALKERERDLLSVEQQLEHGRARMNNSVGGVNKVGVRWKMRERKR
ncbi:MAG: hypothetical protein Q9219_005638 [cf. Caloplaca sp. 3 TL-2023]